MGIDEFVKVVLLFPKSRILADSNRQFWTKTARVSFFVFENYGCTPVMISQNSRLIQSRNYHIGFFLVSILCFGASVSRSQVVDPTFYPKIASVAGIIYTSVLQPNRKVLIGGSFNRAGASQQVSIARLNADGTIDQSFAASVSGSVSKIELQNDGKILVAGAFNTVNGVSRSMIARLNDDGTLDTMFQGPSINSDLKSIALQSDGKIVIGGNFSLIGGTSSTGLARLNSDGTLDSSFNMPTLSLIHAIAVQADGKILIGGRFRFVNSQPRDGIARLNTNGTLDMSYNASVTGNDLHVLYISLQSDGKALIAGRFDRVNNILRGNIARINTDGTLDSTFQNGMSGTNSFTTFIQQQPDGKIFVCGFFTSINGVTITGIARVTDDGSLDTSFVSPQLHESPPGSFYSLAPAIHSAITDVDGSIIVGGSFQQIGGLLRQHVARLANNGSVDLSFGYIFLEKPGSVYATARQPDNKIIVAGEFRFVNGEQIFNLVRLNNDGSLDTSFNLGLRFPSATSIVGLAVMPDGKILIWGNFDYSVGGNTIRYLARLNSDGSIDQMFNSPNPNSPVYSVSVQNDGKLVIGGLFEHVGGQTRRHIARLNPDGSLDSAFMNGLTGSDGAVLATEIQSDDKILIGGWFTRVHGVNRSNIARLLPDGSLDTSFTAIMSSDVKDIAVQTDAKVLVAGLFTSVNSEPRNRIARLNSDGTLDQNFLQGLTGANNEVSQVETIPDGRILVGGTFSQFNGSPTRLARLNTDGSLDSTFSAFSITHESPYLSAISVEPDGGVLVGGQIEIVNSIARSGIFRLLPDGAGTPSPTATPTSTPTPTQTATPTASPTPAGFESDIAPRPNGDGLVFAGDVIQARRFATGLDTINPSINEFQRADAAPRSTFGDGIINSGDVTQARRYATGLDPLTAASGPVTAASGIPEAISKIIDDIYGCISARQLRLGAIRLGESSITVPVEIDANGDETAITFTLEYDPAILINPQVVLGDGFGADPVLTVNDTNEGKIGILVDSASPMIASKSSKTIVLVTFDVIGDKAEPSVSLSGSVAPVSVSDSYGNPLAARWH